MGIRSCSNHYAYPSGRSHKAMLVEAVGTAELFRVRGYGIGVWEQREA
jgi:hypothetical protein